MKKDSNIIKNNLLTSVEQNVSINLKKEKHKVKAKNSFNPIKELKKIAKKSKILEGYQEQGILTKKENFEINKLKLKLKFLTHIMNYKIEEAQLINNYSKNQ